MPSNPTPQASPSATRPQTQLEPKATLAAGAPLAGVKVLDLTRLLPGPMCTLHLADLGADVIKVEDTGAGDYASAPVRDMVNRNKRGMRLDLKHPAGVDALLALCENADVLVEGFRPGVMDRLGVGWAAVHARNPRLVYASISGYGQSGPLRDEPGHDMNYSALVGVADQMGSPSGELALSNVPVADLLGGTMTAVMGILAALFDAGRTGRGRHVDIAIADGLLAHAVLPMAAVHREGRPRAASSDRLTGKDVTIRSKFLVGADGGNSLVAEHCGSPFEGKMGVAGSMNILFECDLSRYVAHRPSVLYWVLQPGADVGGIGMGLVRMVRPWNEWLIVWGYDINGPEPDVTAEFATGVARQLIGDPDLEIELLRKKLISFAIVISVMCRAREPFDS